MSKFYFNNYEIFINGKSINEKAAENIATILSDSDWEINKLVQNNWFIGPISEDLISKWREKTRINIPTMIESFRRTANLFELVGDNYKNTDKNVSNNIRGAF